MSEIQSTGARSILARIFLSPEEARLRAGWRLLSQTILLFTFVFCLGAPLVLILLIVDPALINSIYQVNLN
jgi:hypothetical protein